MSDKQHNRPNRPTMTTKYIEHRNGFYEIPYQLGSDGTTTLAIVSAAEEPKPVVIKADEHVQVHNDRSIWWLTDADKISPENVFLLQLPLQKRRKYSQIDNAPPDIAEIAWMVPFAHPDRNGENGLSGDQHILVRLSRGEICNLMERFQTTGYERSEHLQMLIECTRGVSRPQDSGYDHMEPNIVPYHPGLKLADSVIRSHTRKRVSFVFNDASRHMLAMNRIERSKMPRLPTRDEFAEHMLHPIVACVLAKIASLRPHSEGCFLGPSDHVEYEKIDGSIEDAYGMDPYAWCFDDMPEDEIRKFITVFQRLGFQVILRLKVGGRTSTLALAKPGNAYKLSKRLDRLFYTIHTECPSFRKHTDVMYFYPRSFRQVRQAGVIKCIPRLLGWLREARISLNDPVKHPEKLAEAAEEFERDMAAGATSLNRDSKFCSAAKQNSRKRKLSQAQFAGDGEVKAGIRWAAIRKLNEEKYKPMRVEAMVGDHFVFQAPHVKRNPTSLESSVVVLHHDEFEIRWFDTVASGEVSKAEKLETAFNRRFWVDLLYDDN